MRERIEPDRALFHIYFQLSADAPPEWEQLFEEERHYPDHTLFRTAKARGEYTILECPLDEIDIHYQDLVKNVANANEAYRKRLGLVLRQEEKESERAKDDGSRLAEIRRKLGFGERHETI